MIRIFLSHSSRDEPIVEPIRAQAQSLEVEVYLHEMHPEPGARLSLKITEAIKASDALVVLVTLNTVTSAYVNQEIGFALGQQLPVIPLVSRGVAGEQLAMLEGVEYISFDPDHPHQALTHLTGLLHTMQSKKAANLAAIREAQTQAALSRQQEISIALGLVCVLLILYIATSGGDAGGA